MPKRAVAVSCDQKVLAFYKAALSAAEYELVSVTRTEPVVNTLHSARPELILLDLDLCRQAAAEILHWIGAQQPRPGLVLVSSGENLEVLREGFVVPDFQLLIKPLGGEEMKEAVTRVSRSSRSVSVQGTGNDKGPGFLHEAFPRRRESR